ncbi:unnamed protein product [Larinioides sclopetarius]|uniref:Secreted protein n=1 Tax=Larinioides sclopetarius TaxID=280406 RepID=A0AAV1ZA34_9ARAC
MQIFFIPNSFSFLNTILSSLAPNSFHRNYFFLQNFFHSYTQARWEKTTKNSTVSHQPGSCDCTQRRPIQKEGYLVSTSSYQR